MKVETFIKFSGKRIQSVSVGFIYNIMVNPTYKNNLKNYKK